MGTFNDDFQAYPVGQQDFKMLREQGLVYVDKTMYIDKILRHRMQYLFLARPRRFGKSLFLSTLRYFFEGRRDLFSGLYIDSTNWEWLEYPVLYLDLNPDRYGDPNDLEKRLDNVFRMWEDKYDVPTRDESYSLRLQNIIKAAHKKTGLHVVILVDEYDKPLVTNLKNKESLELYREHLASIYSNFKSSSEHIRFVMLTGVSRFSKLSVFSDINNINDISFDDEFADICGITETELHHYFKPGINRYASEEGISPEQACRQLKTNYDGYRFSRKGSEIYNPWSVLNFMQKARIEDYWNATGKPTIVVKALHDKEVNLEEILNTECRQNMLQGLDLSNAAPLPLLYQTGYLTIKDYDKETQLYRLGVPNQEVARGLFNELAPYYISVKQEDTQTIVGNIVTSLLKGNPHKMMENIDIFLAGIPYEMKMDNENNFHNALFILLSLIGAQVETEVHTSDGRIDLVVKTTKFIYIIELKFNKDSDTAMSQIEEKEYDLAYRLDPRRIFLIGANFNKSLRRIDHPVIKEIGKEA
ncbi:MAG: ATP-binding protein [Muribaculaceae bacterium]|nr:ATP-binding protein [Muribaculaceae bacterium]